MKFKRNFHVAKEINGFRCASMIEKYPKRYATPKYMTFMREMLSDGWTVKLYTAGRSKYVFVVKGEDVFKIRFSNHKPIYSKQMANDCDYYVGISHAETHTTDQIIKLIKEKTMI